MTTAIAPTNKKAATPAAEPPVAPRQAPTLIEALRDEFDRLLERFVQGWPRLPEGEANGWRWDVNVDDGDDAVTVRAEAPGFEVGDFDIQVAGDRLILKASRKTQEKGKDGTVRTTAQEFYEAVALPAAVDRDKVEAKYRNGILTVRLPKTATGQARKIAVKAD